MAEMLSVDTAVEVENIFCKFSRACSHADLANSDSHAAFWCDKVLGSLLNDIKQNWASISLQMYNTM